MSLVLRSSRKLGWGRLVAWQDSSLSFTCLTQACTSNILTCFERPWEPQFGPQKKGGYLVELLHGVLQKCSGQASAEGEKIKESCSFISKILPKRALPYAELMRWDKPSATWLLVWPCWWSVGLAAQCGSIPDLSSLALLGAGAWLMRGAGCTINDMWDQNIDRKVKRTQSRPLASGAITMTEAWVLLGAQLSTALAVCMQLNDHSKFMAASAISLAVAYPLMKRVTDWPQLVLGLAMNWGALVGYSAVTGTCDWSIVLPLYASGVCWTIVYDTIYACQDMKDDLAIGLKSTALRFGDNMHTWLTGFSVATVSGLAATGISAGCGGPYLLSVACVGAHLCWQVSYLDVKNGPDCMAKFKSNKWLGAILFTGIVADRLTCGHAPF